MRCCREQKGAARPTRIGRISSCLNALDSWLFRTIRPRSFFVLLYHTTDGGRDYRAQAVAVVVVQHKVVFVAPGVNLDILKCEPKIVRLFDGKKARAEFSHEPDKGLFCLGFAHEFCVVYRKIRLEPCHQGVGYGCHTVQEFILFHWFLLVFPPGIAYPVRG